MLRYFMQTVSLADNLHAMSKPIFSEEREKITSLSSAEYVYSIVKDKLIVILHYENTPIQIYRKFHLQKLKKKSDKKIY